MAGDSPAALLLAALLSHDPKLPYKAVPTTKPASADSLAGVLSRLFPGKVDSAGVGNVHWRQSPYDGLWKESARTYGYRGDGARGDVIIRGAADPWDNSITFATKHFQNAPPQSWGTDPEMVKHELAHLLVQGVGRTHPADVFQKLEAYRGR